jgi:hypothetical protein
MSQCATIKHLHRMTEDNESLLAAAAKHAEMIISDIQEEGMTGLDIEMLHSILEPIFDESGASLFEHLIEGAPDCDICAAIKKRITA